jgi:hypothetical protein
MLGPAAWELPEGELPATRSEAMLFNGVIKVEEEDPTGWSADISGRGVAHAAPEACIVE